MSATKYLFCTTPREIKTIAMLNYRFLEKLAQTHFYDGEISAGVLATKTRVTVSRPKWYSCAQIRFKYPHPSLGAYNLSKFCSSFVLQLLSGLSLGFHVARFGQLVDGN